MKKYKTILADPPWQFGASFYQRQSSHPSNQYECMDTENICNLELDGVPIQEYIDKSAHLYLWTTVHHLLNTDSIKVCLSWGFKLITILTWCKSCIGLGYYFRQSTEHIIFGVKGKNIGTKRDDQGTYFIADRGKHSVKPTYSYELIEEMSHPPYLELFGRRKRDGWDVWGNEVELGKQLKLF